MFVLLSPAKKQVCEAIHPDWPHSVPAFQDQTARLLKVLSACSPSELSDLLGVSASLAELNHARFQKTAVLDGVHGTQACLGYLGDTYRGLMAAPWAHDAADWAQSHVGIISAFYGLLRPYDVIAPYRLEMGTSMKRYGMDLYAFWGDLLTKAVRERAIDSGADYILNLTSKMYGGVLDAAQLGLPLVQVDFKEPRAGGLKIIGLKAKYARGLMASWVVRHRVTALSDLKGFEEDGYAYAADHSSPKHLVFVGS